MKEKNFSREKTKRRFTLLNTVKNLSILLLTVSAMYLAGRLWFEEIADRKIELSNIMPSKNEIIYSTQSSFIEPFRILTNIGVNKFDMLYNTKTSQQYKDCREVINLVLSEGKYEGESAIQWQMFLNEPSYIYDYNFSMPADLFTSSLSDKINFLSKNPSDFDSIIIVPNNTISVSFVNWSKDKSFNYKLENSQLGQQILLNIENIRQVKRDYYYVSSTVEYSKMFKNPVFLPEWELPNLEYKIINLVNPYLSRGQLLLNTVEKQVDCFFDKPASKWSGTANGAFTYSDEYIVVKYYPTDILEYSDYRTYDKNNVHSTIADYAAALNFIAKDKTIINDFYLAEFSSMEGRSVFYFNYTINNFPLIVSNNIKAKAQINYPIEVVVEYQNVRKFKKLAYNYEIDKSITENVEIDYGASLNMLIPTDSLDSTQLDNALLCYNIDKSKQLILYWYLDIFGKTYAQSSK